MNTYELITTRRSTRRFKDTAVPEEDLNEIIEAGRFAPSGGNNQSTHFFVITDKAVLDKLADMAQASFAAMELKEGMYPSLASSIHQSKNGNYRFHYNAQYWSYWQIRKTMAIISLIVRVHWKI